MNNDQRKAIETCLPELMEAMDLGIRLHLRATNILSTDDLECINALNTSKEKRLLLLEIIKNRDQAWDAFLIALKDAKQNFLKDALEKALRLLQQSDNSDFSATLKLLTRELSLEPFRFWKDFLYINPTFSNAFHPLQILRSNAARLIDQNRQQEIKSYNYLNSTDDRIYFIEGDPGIGKSTYVSKLTYDWATGNDEICELFETIFLIRCAKVDANKELPQQICQSIDLMEHHINIIVEKLKSQKTLLIFDGYDENPLKVVNHVIESPKMTFSGTQHYVFAKILVTARGTHAPIKNEKDKFPDRLSRCDFWLKIMGFSEEDIDAYLAKHNVEENGRRVILACNSSMKQMLQNPLMAMMCVSLGITGEITQEPRHKRLNKMLEYFMMLNEELSKRKEIYTETAYTESCEAVCEYAAYLLCQNHSIFAKVRIEFARFKPDNIELTKFGLVRCEKSKKNFSSMQEKYEFLHETFLEYFAAKWFYKRWWDVKPQYDPYSALPSAFVHTLINRMLATGKSVQEFEKDGWTSLHYSARQGYFNSLKELIAAGADVKAGNKVGETALHIAAFRNSLDCLKELIAAGADVNAVDEIGRSALHHAAFRNFLDCLKELIAAGADVNAMDRNGLTALNYAISHHSFECLKELIAAGADVNALHMDGIDSIRDDEIVCRVCTKLGFTPSKSKTQGRI